MNSAQKFSPVIVVLAMSALLIGSLVYLLDRPADSVYFMSPWMAVGNNGQSVFNSLGSHIPTFTHVYAFILLTSLLLTPTSRNIVAICLFWFCFDSLFEIAQANSIANWIATHTPEWFQGIPFIENIPAYFQGGTFDFLDLVSIATGALAAHLTITISIRRSFPHVYRQQDH